MSEALFFAILLAIGILSGATAAVIGFGIGSLLTPFLLTRLEPHLAISVVALPHLIATGIRYVHYRQWVHRTVLLRFGVPSALGGLLGAVLQGTLRSAALVSVLAILLILTGIANLTRGFGGWRPGSIVATVLGLLSGIFGGLVGNQGGLRAAGLTAFALEPRAYIATATAVALLIDAARTPIYLARGAEALVGLAAPIAVATVGCVAGTILGERVFFRIPADRYRTLVGAAVIALGVWLFASSR
jgi:uncharacterized membrane protein YfcA